MNKTYRSIWNEALGAWVATSELSGGRRKGAQRSAVTAPELDAARAKKSRSLRNVGALTLAACAAMGGVHAQNYTAGGGTASGSSGIAIGCATYGATAGSASGDMAIGCRASATGANTIALGVDANANGSSAISVGSFSAATASAAAAFGLSAKASGIQSTALGASTTAAGESSLAAGYSAMTAAAAGNAIALGYTATANSRSSIAVGSQSIATGLAAVAFGNATTATGDNALAVGSGSKGTGAGATAFGAFANADGVNVTAIGLFARATTDASTAVGAGATALALNATSVGQNAAAVGGQSTAVGRAAQANALSSLAAGDSAQTDAAADNASAIGKSARANGVDAVALGTSTLASGTNSIAAGKLAQATATDALALGAGGTGTAASAVNATAAGAVAIGGNTTAGANASAADAIAIGGQSVASSAGAVAVGRGATASGGKSVSIGDGNTAYGNGAVSIGDPSYASGTGAFTGGADNIANSDGTATATASNQANGAVAIGNGNKAIGQGSVALGNGSTAGASGKAGNIAIGDSASATASAGDVALGSGSSTAAAVGTASSTIAGTTYNFAGTTPTSTVSVGSVGAERTVTNVAAGRISGTSTDAINGSQLYATNQALVAGQTHYYSVNDGGTQQGNYANDGATGQNALAAGVGAQASGLSATALGQGANAQAASSIAIGVNATAQNAVGGTVAIGNGSNSTGQDAYAIGTVAEASGQSAYAIGSIAKASGAASTAVGYEANASASGAQALGTRSKASADNAVALGSDAVAADANAVALGSQSVTAAPVGTAGTTIAGTTYNFAGTAPGSTVSVGSVGNERTVTNVAAGRISGTSTDAINGSQLYATNQAVDAVNTTANKGWNVTAQGANGTNVAPGASVDLKNTDGNVVIAKTTATNDVSFNLAPNLTATSVTTGNTTIDNAGLTINGGPSVTSTGINANNTVITNVAAGTAATDAVNVSQLNTVANNPLTFSGNDNAAGPVTRKLGETLAITGTATTAGTYSGANLKTVTDATTGTVNLQMADSPAFTSVTTGNTTIDNAGLTITGGPSITNTGIDAGNTVITNVAPGTAGTDAVNVDQLNVVNTTANKGWNVQANGDTATKVAPGDTVQFKDGQNIAVTRTGTDITIATTPALTADSLTINGGPVINNAGITMQAGNTLNMGGNQITNLAAGTAATDAVNVDQLTTTVAASKTKYYSVNSSGGGNENNAGATGADAIASGKNAVANGSGSVAMGVGAKATGSAGVVGLGANTYQGGAVSIGADAQATASLAVALGNGSRATSQSAIALGTGAEATGINATAVGRESRSTGLQSTSVGVLSLANGISSTALGGNANAIASGATSLGALSTASGSSSVAVGIGATSSSASSIAIGRLATAAASEGDVALGAGSVTAATVGTPGTTINGTTYGFAGITPTSTVSVGAVGAERTITNVAAGRINATSTDAINGSQLNATNTAIQDVSTVAGKGWNLSANGEATPQNIAPGGTADFAEGDNIAITRNGSTITVATAKDVNFDSVTTGTTVMNNAGITVGPNVSLGATGLVILNGPSVTTAGIDAGGKVITNVAAGVAPTDAVNVSQLTQSSNTAANKWITGSPTTYTAPVSTGTDSTAVGSGASVNANNSVAVGTGASATTDNSVALGNGSTTSAAVATTGATIAGSNYSFAGSNPAGVVSVGSAGNERQVQNVAAGQLNASSTDAVNGSQLYATNQAISTLTTSVAANTTHYYSVNDAGVQGANYNNDGASGVNAVASGVGASASGVGGVAVGLNATATTSGGVAIGAGALADRTGMNGAREAFSNVAVSSNQGAMSVGSAGGERQITNVAGGTAATDAVNVRQLTAVQQGAVNYATNADGSANYNQITLGNGQASGGTTISNVAPGVAGTDAANVDQLNAGVAGANQYTDQRFNQARADIDKVGKRASAGTAGAMAMANLPQAYIPGKSMLSVGVAGYDGESALAFGVSKLSDNGRWVVKFSGTGNSRGKFGIGAGAGFHW